MRTMYVESVKAGGGMTYKSFGTEAEHKNKNFF
jgi:hypothetical protein